eukprot:COSAG02_NODE_9454_length_2211_cov_1.458807_1_plen_84_part_00
MIVSSTESAVYTIYNLVWLRLGCFARLCAQESAMATMISFFSRCLPEGAVVVRTAAEEVMLQGGNPSQVDMHALMIFSTAVAC